MPSIAAVEHLLTSGLSWPNAADVAEIGAGAWSTAFGFRDGARDLVIRIGNHESDFRRDQEMARLTSPALPIPAVLDIGQTPPSSSAEGGHYCISTRAFGTPLESCRVKEWPTIVEQVADALEAMRAWTPRLAAQGATERGVVSWKDQLLLIERDDLDSRGAGWPAKLAKSARGEGAFDRGIARLRATNVGDVPLTLVHGDLINRNAHVEDGSITGIFDWGCQRWGDHLFDLAWFDSWSPWHPNLDIGTLRAVLHDRWSKANYTPHREADRTTACLVYIGLEHLIYNAVIGRWNDLDDVVDRMTTLDLI